MFHLGVLLTCASPYYPCVELFQVFLAMLRVYACRVTNIVIRW